jgi:hypothetical protein
MVAILHQDAKKAPKRFFFLLTLRFYSHSIINKPSNAPAELLWSAEADLIAPRQTGKLDSIGELSQFRPFYQRSRR